MRTFVTTAAIVTALTFPAFAQDQGSLKKPQQQPKASQSYAHVPSAPPRAQAVTTETNFFFLPGEMHTVDPATMPPERLKSPSGADGGNRR